MNKMIAFLMTLLMVLGMAGVAQAAEVPEVVFDESAAAFAGDWVTFSDDGFMLYLPTGWVDIELTDEMLAAGTYYTIANPEKTCAMSVSYIAEVGVTDSGEIMRQLEVEGYESVTPIILNGIGAVGYDISAQDVSGLAFADGEGGMFVLSFKPASSEEFMAIAQTILSSLNPMA